MTITTRRVRGLLNHKYIFDTTEARYVWEDNRYPYYYVPISSLTKYVKIGKSPETADAKVWIGSLIVGDRSTDRVIFFDEKLNSALAGLARVEFSSIGELGWSMISN